MARTRRAIKTYHPHNFATIIYGLFALGMVALFVVPFLQPFFNFAIEGGETVSYTAFDYVKIALSKFIPAFNGEKQVLFLSYYDIATPDNELLKIIMRFHNIIELVILGFMALVAIFAVVEFFVGFFWIILGKSNKSKRAKSLAWAMFWFYAIALGLLFMYFFFYQQIITFAGATVSINYVLMTFVYLGGMFVVAFIMMIINRAYFKDRVSIDKKGDERLYTVSDTSENQNAPQPQAPIYVQQQYAPVNNNAGVIVETRNPNVNPNGIITVGENAYAKNVEITSATVPEGIISLGSSAFANCVNLVTINLPETLREIGFNCFFNTPKLTNIIFNGSVEKWKIIKRGSNWLMKSGTRTVQCKDGKINVNPRH